MSPSTQADREAAVKPNTKVFFGEVIPNPKNDVLDIEGISGVAHANGIHIESAKDAAMALAPLAGKYASDLFALGLLNASLFAASILPLSTAYTVCEAFGWESSVDCKFEDAPQFYILYSLMIVLGAGLVMIPDAPLIPIMYFSQVLNGLVLPVILFFMIRLINEPSVMGEQVNGRLANVLTWLTAVLLSLLSILTVVTLVW